MNNLIVNDQTQHYTKFILYQDIMQPSLINCFVISKYSRNKKTKHIFSYNPIFCFMGKKKCFNLKRQIQSFKGFTFKYISKEQSFWRPLIFQNQAVLIYQKSKFEISKVYEIRLQKYKGQKIRICYQSIPLNAAFSAK